MPHQIPVRVVTRLVMAVWVTCVLTACGSRRLGSPPLPTPGGYTEIFESWVLNGIAVHERTSGDPVAATSRWPTTPSTSSSPWRPIRAPRDVYLFRFRNSVRWADEVAVVDACQAAFEAISARAGGPVSRIDVSPYRAFGDGWTPELRAALERGLARRGRRRRHPDRRRQGPHPTAEPCRSLTPARHAPCLRDRDAFSGASTHRVLAPRYHRSQSRTALHQTDRPA